MHELIMGGARSGKSRLAEELAQQHAQKGARIIYVATAGANDSEMQQRIEMHRSRRPTEWQTIECPLFLADTIQQNNNPGTVLLIDCLTLWISNLLCDNNPELFIQQRSNFLKALKSCHASVIMVSNETGLGIVPMGELTRRFVDESGFLHQEVARMANKVTFMVAGLPQILKQE